MSYLGKLLLSAGKLYVPTTVGEAWQGGYYAGRITVDGQSFALVVAPLATGYTTGLALNTAAGVTTSGFSRWDGASNMALMSGTAWPAAQWARGLNIGGFTDWHLPAEDQLDICYRAFRPVNPPNTSYGTNPSMDPPKGNYTSTDPAETTAVGFRTGESEAFEANFYGAASQGTTTNNYYIINFNGGTRTSVATNSARNWRAVRMVRIS